MITINRLEHGDQLRELAGPWQELLAGFPRRNAFLTFDWHDLWWQYYGKGRELWLLVVREGSEIVGIAPLVLTRQRWRGLPVRKLGFMQLKGAGIANYGDVLVASDPVAVWTAILGYLEARRDRWDVLALEAIPRDSPTLSVFRECLRASRLVQDPAPRIQLTHYIVIDQPWDVFWRTRPRPFRRNYRLAERRLDLLGPVQKRRVTAPDEIAAAYDRFCAIERNSWKGAARDDERAFHAALVRRFAASGGCEIRLIEVGEVPIAGTICLIYERTIFGIKTCYDEAYRAASPGRLVIHFTVQGSFEVGLGEIDLLGDSRYMDRWTSHERQSEGETIYSPTMYPRLLRFARNAMKGMRRTRVESSQQVSPLQIVSGVCENPDVHGR